LATLEIELMFLTSIFVPRVALPMGPQRVIDVATQGAFFHFAVADVGEVTIDRIFST
jgi:hypothetical protein